MTRGKVYHEVSCPQGHKFKTKATRAARCPVCKKDFSVRSQVKKKKIRNVADATPREASKPASSSLPPATEAPGDLLSIPQDIPPAQDLPPEPSGDVGQADAPEVAPEGAVAPPASAAALGRYFKCLGKAIVEGLKKKELSDETMGNLIGATLEVCGDVFNLEPTNPENQIKISPMHLIGMTIAAIAAPYVIPMLKDKFGKKKMDVEEDGTDKDGS